MKLIFSEDKHIPTAIHPRLVRWALFLSGYDYKIVYSKNVTVADCLSRLPSELGAGDDTINISQDYVLNVRSDALVIRSIPDEISTDPVLNQIWTSTLER